LKRRKACDSGDFLTKPDKKCLHADFSRCRVPALVNIAIDVLAP